MSDTAYLVLENEMVFEGKYFGAKGTATGELVFTTGMTGYLETLTDKSCFGQIVLQTFPLIGNYGVIPEDFESDGIWASAYIVKYWCQEPSNFRSEGDLDAFFKSKNIVGLHGVDTRSITKIIRENGVMNARIMDSKPEQKDFEDIRAHKTNKAIESVSINETLFHKAEQAKFTVAMLDFGADESLKRELLSRGCDVWVFPHNSTANDLMKINPDGIMLSNGPGDPAANAGAIENLKEIMALGIPMFGVCLGHQLMALASGFRTYKLKYGHRGTNQPVKDVKSDRVYITGQNHGYAVVSESIDCAVAEESFVNLNDGTCEGIEYKSIPAFSTQFCPKSSGGPVSTAYLFDKFTEDMEERKNAVG